MLKIFDVDSIKQALIGGYVARRKDTRIRQMAYAIILGIFGTEILQDDSIIMDISERIEVLILAVQNSPTDIGFSILQKMKIMMQEFRAQMTERQKTLIKDCYAKVGMDYE
jgi:hypothetical protein